MFITKHNKELKTYQDSAEKVSKYKSKSKLCWKGKPYEINRNIEHNKHKENKQYIIILRVIRIVWDNKIHEIVNVIKQ